MTAADLAGHYTHFRVADRLLLTGHSHQAWPDVARDAVVLAFDDAAECVDDKWGRALEQAALVSASYAELLGHGGAGVALGVNTHELVLRFLSGLDLRTRPRLVTTDGEFHTLRRQLGRLAEAGLDVVRVPAVPEATLADRVAAAVDDRTAAVLASCVLFETSRIVQGLETVADACARHGAELLLDAYHALGCTEPELPTSAWVVGGGYKYLQLGEGVCFLRVPVHAAVSRPVITGWYAEFDALADTHDPDRVAYGRGASAFAGSTYDPTSHYRAVAVRAFFAEQGLTPAALRASYQAQLAVLAEAFDALDLPPGVADRDRETPLSEHAGFLSLVVPDAGAVQKALRARGVQTDSRGDRLRFGPAPYLTDRQLRDAMAALGDAVQGGRET